MDQPVNITHHLQLKDNDVDLSQICFGSVTMESDKFIACKRKLQRRKWRIHRESYKFWSIIDVFEPNSPPVLDPNPADSLKVHPSRKEILAVQSGTSIVIYETETDMKIETDIYRADNHDQSILFWKWVNEDTICFIAANSTVYHIAWNDVESPPVAMFAMKTALRALRERCRIVDYRMDGKHVLIVGEAKSVRSPSLIQLHNIETGQSEIIEANAACFVKNESNSTLLAYSSTYDVGWNRLKVVDLNSSLSDAIRATKAYLLYTIDESDSPISMHASATHGLIFLMTKRSFVHIFDIESSKELYETKISDDTICVTTDYSKGGVMAISRKGLVLSVSINEQAMIEHVWRTNRQLADTLPMKWKVDALPSAPPLDMADQNEMGGSRRRRESTDVDPFPLTETIKDILRAAGQDPSKMSKKEIKFVYDFIHKYQEDWIATEVQTPIYENLPLQANDSHPSEPVHPPIPAPRPSLARAENLDHNIDWRARAEKAEKKLHDLEMKYRKVLMMMGRLGTKQKRDDA